VYRSVDEDNTILRVLCWWHQQSFSADTPALYQSVGEDNTILRVSY